MGTPTGADESETINPWIDDTAVAAYVLAAVTTLKANIGWQLLALIKVAPLGRGASQTIPRPH